MMVLIVIEHSPKQRFLVKLHTEALIREVTKLIERRRHSQAMVTALSKGRFAKEIDQNELPNVKADLILSKDSVSWDLMK